MPIRINLLAEQIAAEEMRRRDPLKRAIQASVVLVILVLFYSAMLQMKVGAARSEFARVEGKLKALEDNSKQVKADRALDLQLQANLASLDKFSTNRFLWGSALDAVQRAVVPNIRVMQILSEQRYLLLETNKFFTTNITVSAPAIRKSVWRKEPNLAAAMLAITNELKLITKRAPFTTNSIPYVTKVTLTATNDAGTEFTARLDFTLPQLGRETTTMDVSGRDYAPPPGALDDFIRQIEGLPFFKERLRKGENGGINTKERPPQPRLDPAEPWEQRPYLPFTIQCEFQDRILANE